MIRILAIFTFLIFFLTGCGRYYNQNGFTGPTGIISLTSNSGTTTRSLPLPTFNLQFNQVMLASTVNNQNVVLTCGSQTFPTTITTSDNQLFSITPVSRLPAFTQCTITVKGLGNGVLNLAHVGLVSNLTLNFTTENKQFYVSSFVQVGSCAIDIITGTATNCSVSPGVNSLYSPKDIAIASVNGTKYAYIVNNGTPDITMCSVGTGGVMLRNNCTSIYLPLLNKANGIAIYNSYAYITVGANAGNSKVISCQINQTTGFLSSCQDTTASALNVPFGIAIYNNGPNTFAYIGNDGQNSVTLCTVNASTGILSSCVNSGAGVITKPHYIAINPVQGTAYIQPLASSSVTYCTTINPGTGALSGCSSAATGSSNPSGKVSVSSDGNSLYIASGGNNQIVSCNISAGTPSGCGNTTATLVAYPIAVTLDNNGFAYIVNQIGTPNTIEDESVTSCQVNGLTFSGCQNSNANTYSNPYGFAFANFSNQDYAYISNVYGFPVSSFMVNPNTGVLSNGQNAQVDTTLVPIGDHPTGLETYGGYLFIADPTSAKVISCKINGSTVSPCQDVTPPGVFVGGRYPVGLKFNSNNGFMYVTGDNNTGNVGNILVCTPTSAGTLVNCVDSGAGPAVGYLYTMDFDTIASTTYVYLPNNYDSSFNTNILKCIVAPSTGKFSNCVDSGLGNSFFSLFGPSYLVVQSGYLYVADGFATPNRIVSCLINSDGSLTSANCANQISDGVLTAVPFSLALY